MSINLIMAADNEGGIGYKGKLPWQDPEDLKWFKRLTMDGIVVVGRNTFLELPELKDREVRPVSKDEGYWNLHQALTVNPENKEVWVAGGAMLYETAMPFIHRFYISRIPGIFDVDTHASFPLPWIPKST